jgi:hypothetical protein
MHSSVQSVTVKVPTKSRGNDDTRPGARSQFGARRVVWWQLLCRPAAHRPQVCITSFYADTGAVNTNNQACRPQALIDQVW